ncbi:MAG TPA: phasin family protein [Anaerolineales bacterium]
MPTKEKVEGSAKGEELKPLFEAARKVLLAGIGAIALAQDEIEEFVNRLVERGEIAEQDGKKLIRELKDKRKKEAQQFQDEVTKRVEETLLQMNIPSKEDIKSLSDKIATLSKKVDELKKAQQQ